MSNASNTPSAWVSIPITEKILRGAIEIEQTKRGVMPPRVPAWARAQCNDPQLAMAESQPSGVRLVFRSRATEIERMSSPRGAFT